MKKGVVLIVLIINSLIGFGQSDNGVLITNQSLSSSQGENIGVFIDENREFNTVEGLEGQKFERSNQAIPDFNFTNNRVWLKFSITNKSDFTDFILETARPVTNTVEFYEMEGDVVVNHYISGDDYAYYDKIIEHRKNLFPISIDSNETKSYYIKLESDGELLFAPLIVHNHMNFFAQDFKDQFKNGFYYGLISLVVIIYFFFFVFLRDKSFLFYILYALSQGVLQFSLDGFTHHHFFPAGGYITNHTLLFFAGFTVIFLLTYVNYFLQLKERNLGLWRTFLISRIVMGLIMIMSLIPGTPYELAFPIINGASLFGVLLGAFSIIYLRVKGFKVDIFFAIAFIILIIGGVVFILGNLSIVGDKIISLGALKLSSALEFVILSISMSNKYGKLQKDKQEAQRLAFQNLQEKNEIMDQVNVRLEQQVSERTSRIEEQKEELEKSNQEIYSSIKYAERIQNAILPSEKQIKDLMPNSFIFYKPKDVVSGDFYFVEAVKTTSDNSEDFVVFAAVDCTGHGVPGALMSIVGHNLLTQSLKTIEVNSPGDALDFLNAGVGKTLRRSVEGFVVRDGMDIAMCALRADQEKMMFAGAKNPLYLIRAKSNIDKNGLLDVMQIVAENDDSVLIEIKGTKTSIGNAFNEKNVFFQNHEIDLFKGDQIIVFSDGFADQFGGPKHKKYTYKRFREILLSINKSPMHEQKETLVQEFDKWQGSASQTDDILVMSIKI